MSGKKKVVKFRRRRDVNIGIIVFLIMFVYIAINVYIYFTKEHLSIYEVQAGSNSDDTIITGLILREEELINTNEDGYLSYYVKEGAKVARSASVYSIGENRQVYDTNTVEETSFKLTKENNAYIKSTLNTFQDSFSNENFSEVYDFKNNVENTVLELLTMSMVKNSQTLLEETGLSSSHHMLASTSSGIVTYYMDSYESVDINTLSKEHFNQVTYQRTSLISTEIITANTPVYKLITSDNWSIILPLSDEQYLKLEGKSNISFTDLRDGFKMNAPVELFLIGSDHYAQLSLNKYLSKYLEDRFIEIELSISTAEGLKIPHSSIIEKEFYLVPIEYFTSGGDSTKKGLTIETYSKNGDITYTFTPTDIYFQDDTYGYVDAKQFALGTWIRLLDTSDRVQISQMGTLEGVYNVNKGYSVFKRIEVLYENDEYCIIAPNTDFGLSIYDHIALDGKTAVEQEIIY